MLYARAALNAKGGVRFGLRHIRRYLYTPRIVSMADRDADVLNRFTDVSNSEQTVHIMKYIFPRQFSLHNVFTSRVDPRDTAQPFKDYTLREQEICRANSEKVFAKAENGDARPNRKSTCRLPKRLRGSPADMVCKLRKLHERCSYTELLRHYCSVEVLTRSTAMHVVN